MAVRDNVPGITIEIVRPDNTSQDEFSSDEDIQSEISTPTVEKYVEAISGAHFGIRGTITPNPTLTSLVGRYVLVARILVEGTYMDWLEFTSVQVPSSQSRFGARNWKDGHSVERDFHFSPLDISEDHSKKIDPKLAEKLAKHGTITIALHRCLVIELPTPTTTDHRDETAIKDQISEKALKGKALSHSVGLGKERVTVCRCVRADYLDPLDKPLAAFNYKYRSRTALKAIGVIPRDETIPPVEDRPLDTLSVEEMRDLLRKQRAREEREKSAKRKIKRELNDDPEHEQSAAEARAKRARTTGAELEIIDLT